MESAATAANRRPRTFPSRDVLCASAAGALALALYVATLQPDLGGPEDTPKFQFLGYVLGTAHPPGYPLYVMLSHVFVQLPVGTIAYRANLFSAVMASFAVALAYLITRQLGARRSAALAAAAGLATGYSFWTSAVFAEVYSLAAVMAALTISLLLAWGARGGTRLFVAAVAAFGLGLGVTASVSPFRNSARGTWAQSLTDGCTPPGRRVARPDRKAESNANLNTGRRLRVRAPHISIRRPTSEPVGAGRSGRAPEPCAAASAGPPCSCRSMPAAAIA